jgi:hypothetical protein
VKALDPNTSMTIKAGQHTTIDPNVIGEIRLGLGWQTNGEAIDLDAGNIYYYYYIIYCTINNFVVYVSAYFTKF